MKFGVYVLILAGYVADEGATCVCAQSIAFTRMHTFISSDGANPQALTLSDARLFGAASLGATGNSGAVFSVNTDGSGFTNVYDFTLRSSAFNGTNGDGAGPNFVLVEDDTIYGSTAVGGLYGNGTIFRVNSDGLEFTNLHTFGSIFTSTNGSNSDGAEPGGIVIAGNRLYGVTGGGGSNGWGSVFGVNVDGTAFTNLHGFDPDSNEGYPLPSIAISGNTLFGTAPGYFGTTNYGALFCVNTDGSGFTNLHYFDRLADGARPFGPLSISGNTLFGVAPAGGSASNGTVFCFRIDDSSFTVLHNFAPGSGSGNNNSVINSDGAIPKCSLVLSGNSLYGSTQSGGSFGSGTLFRMNTNGTGFTNLYDFATSVGTSPINSDGVSPMGTLVLSDNTLFGVAYSGGTNGSGTVFSFALPEPPLNVAAASNEFVISWPGWTDDFLLQSASDLTSKTWDTITNGLTNDGTNYSFVVNPSQRAAFFRLSLE